MPFVIAIAIAVVGFLWWAWGRDRVGSMAARRLDRVFRRSDCKWAQTGEARGSFVEYRCRACGVAGYSRTDKPPETCKRNLKSNG